MARRSNRQLVRGAVAAIAMVVSALVGGCRGERPPSSGAVARASYPARAIRLVVPFPAGGGADVWGRFVAGKLAPVLGAPIEVANVPGQGGNRGTEVAAGAPADGYTLLLGSVGPLVVHRYTYNHLAFDAERDFVPVGLLESSPLMLLVHPNVRATSVEELVELARASTSALSFATNGNGSPEQVAGELFERLVHVELRDVPYDGAGPARGDLAQGKVTMMFDMSKAVMPAVREGRQRALAVADTHRSHHLPSVPTFGELGYSDFDMRIWTGLFAPRGTPAEVVAKVNAALRVVLDDPATKRAIDDVGGDPMPMTPEEVTRFLRSEQAKWQGLVTRAGVPRVDGPT